MDYSAYDRIIIQRMILVLVISGIIAIAAVICIIYLLKNRPEEKAEFLILFVLSCIAITGSLILAGDIVVKSVYDVKNHAYVVTEGTFLVIDDEHTPSRGCSLILADGTRLDTRKYVFVSDEYVGRVVYGIKTNYVIEVQID